MCGIAGFAGEDQPKIARMVAAVRHRGPDHQASLVTNGASIGSARLAILDPTPAGNQPMWNDARTVVITYNGEIYNFRELRAAEDFACRTNTDTEVLLKLFDRYGTAFLPRLRGMFAFGIYDTRAHTWHLARSADGILPLFVAFPEGALHFASESRALLATLPRKPVLNMTALSLYMRLQYVPGPATLCEGIAALPPGTLLTWRDGQVTETAFHSQVEDVHIRSRAEARERIPAVIGDAVAAHLLSDRPVGVFLSGGMDSSIILHHVCTSHPERSREMVRTFTVRFEATEEEGAERFNTDADFAKKTALHYGTDHTELLLTAADFRNHYRDTARALDQPNADSVSVAQFLLAKKAKETVDVILCGAGGDEAFGGYPRYRVARVLATLSWIPPALRGFVGAAFGYPGDVLRLPPGPMLWERLLARPADEIRAVVRGDWFDARAATRWFAQRGSLRLPLPSEERTDDTVRAFMEFDRATWLPDESLRLSDAMTLAHGVECRVPLVDPAVIALARAIPSSWLVTPWRTKALLKDTYRSLLPNHLFALKKASFYPPLSKWLRRECFPLIEDTFEHPRIRDLFDVATLRALADAHRRHETYALHTLSSLIQLAAWFESVYDEKE